MSQGCSVLGKGIKNFHILINMINILNNSI